MHLGGQKNPISTVLHQNFRNVLEPSYNFLSRGLNPGAFFQSRDFGIGIVFNPGIPGLMDNLCDPINLFSEWILPFNNICRAN